MSSPDHSAEKTPSTSSPIFLPSSMDRSPKTAHESSLPNATSKPARKTLQIKPKNKFPLRKTPAASPSTAPLSANEKPKRDKAPSSKEAHGRVSNVFSSQSPDAQKKTTSMLKTTLGRKAKCHVPIAPKRADSKMGFVSTSSAPPLDGSGTLQLEKKPSATPSSESFALPNSTNPTSPLSPIVPSDTPTTPAKAVLRKLGNRNAHEKRREEVRQNIDRTLSSIKLAVEESRKSDRRSCGAADWNGPHEHLLDGDYVLGLREEIDMVDAQPQLDMDDAAQVPLPPPSFDESTEESSPEAISVAETPAQHRRLVENREEAVGIPFAPLSLHEFPEETQEEVLNTVSSITKQAHFIDNMGAWDDTQASEPYHYNDYGHSDTFRSEDGNVDTNDASNIENETLLTTITYPGIVVMGALTETVKQLYRKNPQRSP